MQLEDISNKILAGQRISDQDYLALEEAGDFFQLGFLADSIRLRKHPEKIVTYVIDRNINYTDICISACKFCAFFKTPEEQGGYLLSFAELAEKIRETQVLGGTQILLQGGLHPGQPLEYYEEMVRFMKSTGIHVHGFSPPEICHFANLSGKSVKEVIRRLIAAGLDSIPGGGAEILSDRVRNAIAPRKCTADEWIAVMEEAWKRVGISVERVTVPDGAMIRDIRQDGYSLSFTSWIGDFADPAAFLLMWTSDSGLNEGGYRSKEYDALIARSMEEDGKTRLATLAKAEEKLLSDASLIPLYHSISFNVIDLESITGWYQNPLDIHPFKTVGFGVPKARPYVAVSGGR